MPVTRTDQRTPVVEESRLERKLARYRDARRRFAPGRVPAILDAEIQRLETLVYAFHRR